MLSISSKAREMLDKFAEDADDSDLLLRIEIIGRGPKDFNMTYNWSTKVKERKMILP